MFPLSTLLAVDSTGVVATAGITIFVLAAFIGMEVVNKVPPVLHTALLSGSNAISGITLVGALIVAGAGQGGVAIFLGFLAVVFAMTNVVGAFLATHRMLQKSDADGET